MSDRDIEGAGPVAPGQARQPPLFGPHGDAPVAGRMRDVAVVIVGYRNADDVLTCLWALGRMPQDPSFDVFVAENGGSAAMDRLLCALGAAGSPCRPAPNATAFVAPPGAIRQHVFDLTSDGAAAGGRVHVAEMADNLGYAGAINAWLRPLLAIPGWHGAWIVNPDTEPSPSALRELAAYAASRGKGMVGSQIRSMHAPTLVHSRGLAWRKLAGRTKAVGHGAPAAVEPDAVEIETLLDAPSGASLYVTRALIGRIGLMDERYFLYCEDLDWGARARALHELGYAHRSVVPHKGGTTTGGAGTRASVSRLSVYLEFRNRMIFVGQTYPAWLIWTGFAQAVHATLYLAAGSPSNAAAAYRGLLAGLKGETGRPDHIFGHHRS